MVDNNSKPRFEPGVGSTPTDSSENYDPHSDTTPVSVTNEDMEKFFKPVNSTAETTGFDGGPQPDSNKQPGEKYLPECEIIFGEDEEKPEGQQSEEKGTANGKTETVETKAVVSDQEKDAERVLSSAKTEPAMSRDDLSALAKTTVEPEVLIKFNKDLDEFEKRAVTDKLSQRDREEFYGQVGRVLQESKTGNDFYSVIELQTIASDMVGQAAKPGDINQGKMSTCSTAALETALYMQEPSTIARLVSDIALTGKYETVDGGTETVPEKNLRPDKYKADTPPEKARSLASHIAQPALINIKWNRQDAFADQTGKLGKIRYEEGHPTAMKGDSHTRMMDYSTVPPQPFKSSVGYIDPTNRESGLFMQKEVPDEGPDMHMDDLPKIYSQLRGNKGDLTIVSDTEAPGVIKPQSAEHLKQILKDAADRKKPVVLGVHANRGPFLSDLIDSDTNKPLTAEEIEKSRTMHAHHALVATHTDEKDLTTIQNQWGNAVDHTGEVGQKPKIGVQELFDTVFNKSADAAPKETVEDKAKQPTPDEYIKDQQKFVNELASDADVDPAILFNERLTLHHYLDHWGHKDAAHEQAKIIKDSLDERFRSNNHSDLSLSENATSFLAQLEGSGEKEIAVSTLKFMDERFKKIDITDNYKYRQELDNLLKLHNKNGDKTGARDLTRMIISNVLEMHGKPEDISNRTAIQALDSFADVALQHEVPEEAHRIASHLLTNVRAYEKTHGSENETVAHAKQALMYLGDRDHFKEMKATIASETQESYQKLKDKGDITSEASKEMRRTLSSYYQITKNPVALNEIVQDTIKSIIDDPKDPLKENSRDFANIYSFQAEKLAAAGGKELAIPLQQKALKIAMENKETGDRDKIDIIAENLVSMLDSVGRTEDADKVIKETGVEIFRRRKPAKAK